MRIIYLSSTGMGREMFAFLQTLHPEIVYYNLDNQKIQDFSAFDYDLGISFLYTHKIPASEFSSGKKWINFHPGPLPEFRGRNLCYHAIMERSKEFGATLHYMDEAFDTGDIIEVRRFPILDHYTAGDLSFASRRLLASLFQDYLPRFVNGESIKGYKQEAGGRYYRQLPIHDEVELTKEQQYRVRALTFAPMHFSYTMINGVRYKIIPEGDDTTNY